MYDDSEGTGMILDMLSLNPEGPGHPPISAVQFDDSIAS